MRAFLSLGSNVGDRAEHLRAGVGLVAGSDPVRVSRVYQSEPVGGVLQEDFWNLVIELQTTAGPRELLERARAAEAARGRTREVRWGPRTLDVDVLLVDELVSDDPQITLPHPRMFQRRFVLAPLAELAPELVSEGALAGAVGAVAPIGTLESLR